MSKNEPFAPWQCPLCGEKLTGDSTLKCTKGHCFDRAKEGYWHLLPVQSMRTKAPGDSKEMVAARRAFLNAGYYGIFGRALGELCLEYGLPAAPEAPLHLLDAGCGEGWYDLLLNCFSPFAQEEFLRVLRPGGRMIYVVPGAEHLYQMKAVLYEKPYKNPVQQVAYAGFRAIGEREVSGRITVPQDQLEALFAMTPYYWKTPRGGAERLAALPELETEISFRFLLLEKE